MFRIASALKRIRVCWAPQNAQKSPHLCDFFVNIKGLAYTVTSFLLSSSTETVMYEVNDYILLL